MRRQSLLVLLVVCLVTIGGWLLLRGDGGHGGPDPLPRDGDEGTAAELPQASGDVPPASLAGTSGAEAPAADPGTVGDVRVRVVGRGGVPVPDAPVHVVGPQGAVPHVLFANAHGETTVPDLPLDGSFSVVTFRFVDAGLHLADRVPVRSPETILRTNFGLPCEVVVTDAETGRPLANAAWSLYPKKLLVDGEPLPLRRGARPIIAQPGRDLTYRLAVDVPAGYVAWANRAPYAEISRYATALGYVYPLHREADVTIDVLEHDGSPAREPWVTHWSVAGKEGATRFGGGDTEPLALNRLRLRGVPYVAGAVLGVTIALEDPADDRNVEATVRLARPTRLVVHLPHPDEYKLSDVPFPMQGESVIGVEGGTEDLPPTPPAGMLDLQATLRDGHPAAEATVTFRYLEEGYALRGFRESLDDEGRRMQDLPAGTWRVLFHEPGLVQTGVTFEVQAGESTRVRLQEGRGGTVRLRVVDPAGRPLSFARFRVSDRMWRDLEDGVQRLDPHVDESGSRTLRHVSSGLDLEVTAWYAGGLATEDVTVGEGEAVDVTVEVAPAK